MCMCVCICVCVCVVVCMRRITACITQCDVKGYSAFEDMLSKFVCGVCAERQYRTEWSVYSSFIPNSVLIMVILKLNRL
jgi:hypothetical protein